MLIFTKCQVCNCRVFLTACQHEDFLIASVNLKRYSKVYSTYETAKCPFVKPYVVRNAEKEEKNQNFLDFHRNISTIFVWPSKTR